MAERRVDSTGELEGEGTGPLAPCPPQEDLWEGCRLLLYPTCEPFNGFILHPKSNGKHQQVLSRG